MVQRDGNEENDEHNCINNDNKHDKPPTTMATTEGVGKGEGRNSETNERTKLEFEVAATTAIVERCKNGATIARELASTKQNKTQQSNSNSR